MNDADAFMDDIMRQFFGGGASASGGFDDFDAFIEIIEGGNDKAFRKMFREVGKNTRVYVKPKNARNKAAFTKGGNRGAKAQQRQMEKDMMDMMGMGGMGPGPSKKKSKGRGDEEDMEEAMMEEMMMQMMGGAMPGMPGGKKGKGMSEEDMMMQMMMGGAMPGMSGGKKNKKGKGN